MTPFPRVRAGATDPDAIRADLFAFHAAHPGITEATLGVCRTGSGHTGYDILAEQLEPGHALVADLGCGNGPLLRRLVANPALRRIVGVDGCVDERARVGLEDPRLTLTDTLPGGMDAVLSHHAFYLLQPAEDAVAAVASALRPGGLLAWTTTSGRTGDHPVYVELLNRMGALGARAAPAFRGWGDRRHWTPAGRAALFAGPAWEPLEEKDFVLLVREPPEVLMDRVAGFFYTAWLCDPEELRAAWRPLLPAGPDGCAELEWPWAVVVARRSDVPES